MLYKKVRLYALLQWHWQCHTCRYGMMSKYFYSQKLDTKYTEDQKQKILDIVNECDDEGLSQYKLTKARLKCVTKWKADKGSIKSIADIELIQGFSERTANKFFDSILEGKSDDTKPKNKIKGQYLIPNLSEKLVKKSDSVLAIYTTVNSICWSLINKDNYELKDWKYQSMEIREGKRLQITDIMETAWSVCSCLPQADLYVMKSEATTLRAAGSDPNNSKVLAVNLQKSQLVAMIVALINARSQAVKISQEDSGRNQNILSQRVFFLRSTLPFRLFGTLIGNERVASDQTIEMLLPTYRQKCSKNTHVYIPDDVINKYRCKTELEKDMLGRCLFLALTFMDLCIYKNESSFQ